MAHCSDHVDFELSPPPYEAVVPYPPCIPPPGGTVIEVKSYPIPLETTKETQVNNHERQPILVNPSVPPLQEYHHEVREAVPSTRVDLDNPSFLCRKRKTFLVKMYCATFITFFVLLFIVGSALSEGMKDSENSTVPVNFTDINSTVTSEPLYVLDSDESQQESVVVVDDIQ